MDRIWGFAALALAMHAAVLISGPHAPSRLPYLSQLPAAPLQVSLIATRQTAETAPAKHSGVLQARADGQRAPSAMLHENAEVDEAARILDAIVLPNNDFPAGTGDVLEIRVAVEKNGRASRVDILRSRLDHDEEAFVIKQLVAARYVPAQKAGQPVASLLHGAFNPD